MRALFEGLVLGGLFEGFIWGPCLGDMFGALFEGLVWGPCFGGLVMGALFEGLVLRACLGICLGALFEGLIWGPIWGPYWALAYVTYVTVPNIMTYLVVVRAVELLKKIVRAFELLKNRAEPGRAFQNTRLASLISSRA